MENLSKNILITGAANGVGLAISQVLSTAGYKIFATAMPSKTYFKIA